MNFEYEDEYLDILSEELIPAMGCTEPIALAYASAVGAKYLDEEPKELVARCSGNMIKNVRCVTIPNSGGLSGIEAACLLGAIAGDADKMMEVLEGADDDDRRHVDRMLKLGCAKVEFLDSEIPLHFIIELKDEKNQVEVEVRHTHLNIFSIRRNGEVIFSKEDESLSTRSKACREHLSIEGIKTFADSVAIEKIEAFCKQQIQYNMDIAYEGISGCYGLGIGRILRESYTDGVVTRMKAYAAAASEARMDGCELPVIINSGSGNQGIASTVPVIVYASEKNIPREKLYRALIFSSLLTIYQKEFIGKLSAFCGAVSATCAAGAAITYLMDGDLDQIKATIDNTLANIPGIICDGAKISCAAKIATSLDAAMMAHYLAKNGKEYEAFTGILKENAGETISCVGYIGKVGMRQTDKEIIHMMLQ